MGFPGTPDKWIEVGQTQMLTTGEFKAFLVIMGKELQDETGQLATGWVDCDERTIYRQNTPTPGPALKADFERVINAHIEQTLNLLQQTIDKVKAMRIK